MKTQLILLVLLTLGLVGCGNQAGTGEVAGLTAEEASLVQAVNAVRAEAGVKQIGLSDHLVQRARHESSGLAQGAGMNRDLRFREGYENVSFLTGRARAGEGFGSGLVRYWRTDSALTQILIMDASRIGVGVARRSDGLMEGVVLLGQ